MLGGDLKDGDHNARLEPRDMLLGITVSTSITWRECVLSNSDV